MTDFQRALSTTPRLLVVGLIVFGTACHHHQPANNPPAPVPIEAPAPAVAVVRSGSTLIQAMHDRYAPTWYRTLAFTQKTTLELPSGGEIVQTWHESARLPARLRIDTDIASKAGQLFARDSIFTFAGGKLVRADSGSNDLLVLGFDVYAESVAHTLSVLRGQGFDLGRFHESTWHGKPVYVVGALRGDTASKQFWVDRDQLLFVRMLENARQGHTDVRFGKYVQSGGGWVATEVTQLVNGKRKILEQYSDVRTNIALSDALFDPRQWASVTHATSR